MTSSPSEVTWCDENIEGAMLYVFWVFHTGHLKSRIRWGRGSGSRQFLRKNKERGTGKPPLVEETGTVKDLLTCNWLNVTGDERRDVGDNCMLVHVQWAVLPVVDFEMVTFHKEKFFFFFASIGSNLTPKGNHNCWEQFSFINLGNWLTFIHPGKDLTIHPWYVVTYDSDHAMFIHRVCYESKVRHQGRDGDFFRETAEEWWRKEEMEIS